MFRPTSASTFLALLAACVQQPGLEGRAGAVDQDPADPTALPAAPTERQDLSRWTCRPDGAPQPVAFFDADSTLRVSKSGVVTANGPRDVNILPFVAGKIAELNRTGYLVAIVSNQGGVGNNPTKLAQAQSALAFTASQLGALGARVDYFDFAELRDEDEPEGNRKPAPGMGLRLDRLLTAKCEVGIDRERSFMIGDSAFKVNVDSDSPADDNAECAPIASRPADDWSNADRLFARSFGVPFAEPNEYFGWRFFGVFNIENADQLLTFIDAIEAKAATTTDPIRALALRHEAAELRRINEPFKTAPEPPQNQ